MQHQHITTVTTIPVAALDALRVFQETWNVDLAAELATKLTCSEVNAIADLLITTDRPDLAAAWISEHSDGDDEGDEHYCNSELPLLPIEAIPVNKSTAITIPFPTEAITATDPADIIEHSMTARTFRAAISNRALRSVSAHDIANVPGAYQLGGLTFRACIQPMTETGRSDTAEIVAVLVSLTPADEIDVEVRCMADDREHARFPGVDIDQMKRIIRALDYDGSEVLNPRHA